MRTAKKICFFIVCVFGVFLWWGCRRTVNGPQETLMTVFTHLSRDDYIGIQGYVTNELFTLLNAMEISFTDSPYNLKQRTGSTETIDGDEAYVSVYFAGVVEPVTFYFIRAGETWLMDIPAIDTDTYVSPSEVIPYLEDGDILLASTDHLWSYFIRKQSHIDDRFSHVSIVRKQNNTISIIHANGGDNEYDGDAHEVVSIPLAQFLKGKTTVGIYRAQDPKRKYFSEKAQNYIGIPFDYEYDTGTEDKIYCTQLVQIVLREIGTGITLPETYIEERKRSCILADGISMSDHFDEIKLFRK